MAAMRCQHARADTERVAQVEAQAALVRHRLAVVMEHCAEVDVRQRAERAQPPPPQPRLTSLQRAMLASEHTLKMGEGVRGSWRLRCT
eukprot:1229905-Pyramimonas_sp.AAC.1